MAPKLSKFIALSVGFYIGNVLYRSVLAPYITSDAAMPFMQSLTSDRVIFPALIASTFLLLIDIIKEKRQNSKSSYKAPSTSKDINKEASSNINRLYLDELSDKVIEDKDNTPPSAYREPKKVYSRVSKK